MAASKIAWFGEILGVQPRIRLLRSFDQVSHMYLGYALWMREEIGGETRDFRLLTIGGAMEDRMRPVPHPLGTFLIAFYCWVTIAFFGADLLDIVYARAIRGAVDPAQAAAVFAKASDFLLLVVGLSVLASLGAIGTSWGASLPRSLFLASAVLILGELLAPVVLRPLALGPGAGAWVRFLLSASASVLGLLGLTKFLLR